MKMRKLMPMILTAILTFSSIAPDYALAAAEEETASVSEEENGEVLSGNEAEAATVSEDEAEAPAEAEEEAEPASDEEPAADAEPVDEEVSIDYSDVECIQYGTSAEAVDGVVYLPAETIASLNEAEREAYVDFCDDAAELMATVPGMEEVVIYTDEYGRLCTYYEIPREAIDILKGGSINSAVVMEPEDAEDVQDVDLSDEDEDFFDEPDQASCDPEVPVSVNMDRVEIPDPEELDISDFEDPDLYDELMEEYSDLIEQDGLFSSADSSNPRSRFYNQLSSSERKWFDKAYKNMVQKKKNYYLWTNRSSGVNESEHYNAISALEDTYPTKLGWKNPAKGIRFYSSYSWRNASWTHKVVMPKSKHYSRSLNDRANSKVKKLVNEAYEYAAMYYPQSPTYGIVEYFDEWICRNNYYDYVGVNGNRNSAPYYYCHRQYGILLKGYGVCESYALAMSCLLEKAGVPYLYVVGDAGGGHAWNYVLMPDGNWYMLDSTWNDSDNYSTKRYFLIPDDESHNPEGQFYYYQKNFSFPETATSRYYCESEQFSLPAVVVRQGKKATIKPNGNYENMITSDWMSSDRSVVTVTKDGKIKGKKPGSAIVSCRINGLTASCQVVVYQISKLDFSGNDKKIMSDSFSTGSGSNTYTLNIQQKGEVYTAEQLYATGYLKAPKITASKKNVVSVSYSISGDRLILRVTPMRAGKTKIKVKFGGKTAILKLKVQESGAYFTETEELACEAF